MEHGEVLYQAVIKLNPKSKKNSQEIIFKKKVVLGKVEKIPCIIQGAKYRQYEQESGWYLLRRPKTPINEPINVRAIFFRGDERRCDLPNLLNALDDILVHYGIIVDDNWKIIKGHDGSTVQLDRKNPRTELFIERWEQ